MSDYVVAYERLGIPQDQWDKISPEAPMKTRMAVARGLLPIPPDILMGMVFALMSDPDKRVCRAARKTLRTMPAETLAGNITPRSHPKLLEFLARYRRDEPVLMERIYRMASATDATALLIAETATGDLLEIILRNQERLLITPTVYLALRRNPTAMENHSEIQRIEIFLKINKCLPEVPEEAAVEPEGAEPEDQGETAEPAKVAELPPQIDAAAALRLAAEAEVQAALAGLPSPATNPLVAERLKLSRNAQAALVEFGAEGGADYSLGEAEWGFSLDLIQDSEDVTTDEKLNMTERIQRMSPGQKIKLAYMGNAEARKILLRDSNKVVAAAVVKSRRMTDNEVLAAAANRNLEADIFREMARDREIMRKYPVRVALVNNPKCPVNIAVSIVPHLTITDCKNLARNKNVSNIVCSLALKRVKEKERK